MPGKACWCVVGFCRKFLDTSLGWGVRSISEHWLLCLTRARADSPSCYHSKHMLTLICSSCFYRRNLRKLISRLGSAFEVDLLLKRTFLHAIPVEELHKVVASELFQIFDILVALVTCCSRAYVPLAKVRNSFQKVNRILFHNSVIFFKILYLLISSRNVLWGTLKLLDGDRIGCLMFRC